MLNFINQLPKTINKRFYLKWQQLLSLANEGQRLNEANGVMLANQQQVIKKLLQKDTEATSDYGDLMPSL